MKNQGRIIFWVVFLVLATLAGCGKKAPAALVKAVVEVNWPPEVKQQKVLNDPKEVQSLANFFPHLGEGRKSKYAGGWIDWVHITFTTADGKVIAVGTDYNWWAEGEGDWPMDPKFKDYIAAMMKIPQTQPSGSP